MFNKKSDYAQNKCADKIIYITATGSSVILTRADFSNEEEFKKWKLWSDSDYKLSEKLGRSFYDNCIPLDEHLDGGTAAVSAEDELIRMLEAPEHIRAQKERSRQIKDALSEKQYRRLWMYYVERKKMDEIASIEEVTHQNVSKSITRAKNKIKLFVRG